MEEVEEEGEEEEQETDDEIDVVPRHFERCWDPQGNPAILVLHSRTTVCYNAWSSLFSRSHHKHVASGRQFQAGKLRGIDATDSFA